MSNEIIFIDNGTVTSPSGFSASGICAGMKRSGAKDMALICSDTPAAFAGAFTSSLFAAAPVWVCRKRVEESSTVRAVIVNSGNANACTGETGLDNAEKMCAITARELELAEEEVMVSSTGRIGVQLPMAKIEQGIIAAVSALSVSGGADAAAAIMTTDTVLKSAAVELEIAGSKVTIGATAKGAGMIDPNMTVPHATMLCYITTDAVLDNALLGELLSVAVAQSFNRITIDGDMSTNDTAIILANGQSGAVIAKDSVGAARFGEALTALLQRLARKMVLDGEGATKFVTVTVENAADQATAKLCAESVANSLLCKTAWFGCDPNWGRIVAALGYSGAQFEPGKVDVCYDGIPVVRQGGDAGTPEADLAKVLTKPEFGITIDMNSGDASYWVWTCDISYEYVKINAEYHT